VLGGGGCLFGFGFGSTIAITSRFGECVSEGGEEIGESWVIIGGVLPRKGRLPRDGARCKGKAGSGLKERELLLRGGAMVSLKGSGVSERPSMDGIRASSGDPTSLASSSSSLNGPATGIASSGRSVLGGGKVGLDLGT
jgi:hypothetical protein